MAEIEEIREIKNIRGIKRERIGILREIRKIGKI